MNMKVNISAVLALIILLFSCKDKPRTDLAKITFKEPAADLINYDDKYVGGIDNFEAPMSFALQGTAPNSFAFNGVKLDSADITFQLRSDKIRKDTLLYQGGATIDQEHIKNSADLKKLLNKYQADSVIYAYRVRLKTPEIKSSILTQLIKLYGPGIKNPNTDNGLYWNLKNQHRFIFFNPDYRSLIVVDNTNLSKTCYWDPTTGNIDMGGCDIEQYKANILK
ncbi:hypothetical protein [Mucilaginibacter sp. KACC 22063]|uniref:hypothetical protein n=1 Tax=Mucilaginibacter sp. KACC 22063 TaxID=3025666 RepID=UPI00236514BA|nr:hypothetical protein [Mucilaginibacter sp. KACC 22063]WDF55610.1 hypothetical protein PQ461_00875 [Mucilaginibacter sp. KACC 22063]